MRTDARSGSFFTNRALENVIKEVGSDPHGGSNG